VETVQIGRIKMTTAKTASLGLCAIMFGTCLAAEGWKTAAASTQGGGADMRLYTDTWKPSITSAQAEGAGTRLYIKSYQGVINDIQCKTNLSQPNWVILASLLVTNDTYSSLDVSGPAAVTKFYRVITRPLPGWNLGSP
jgi:hypothetical protein